MINWQLLYLAVEESHRLLVGFDFPNEEILSFCLASGGRDFPPFHTSLDRNMVSGENSGNEILGRSE